MTCVEDFEIHRVFMQCALDLADRAAAAGEVPVGAVVVKDDHIIGAGANRREASGDPTSHAEIIAIREAAAAIGDWRLEETALYVTLEPCPMCAGAIINARIPCVVYGCDDPKAGAVRTLYRLLEDSRLNHQVTVVSGVLEEEAACRLTKFFKQIRWRRSEASRND
jgi:tRNA(adenine34) deaminase